jgi:hypothetical protein
VDNNYLDLGMSKSGFIHTLPSGRLTPSLPVGAASFSGPSLPTVCGGSSHQWCAAGAASSNGPSLQVGLVRDAALCTGGGRERVGPMDCELTGLGRNNERRGWFTELDTEGRIIERLLDSLFTLILLFLANKVVLQRPWSCSYVGLLIQYCKLDSYLGSVLSIIFNIL